MEDLSKLLEGYRGKLDDIPRKAILVVASEIIVATPVGEGTLRGDWSIGINQEPPARNGTTEALTESQLVEELKLLKVGGIAKFYNQMPYARRIEYEGWSQQAPEGMLQPAVKRWDLIVEAIVRNGS